MSIEGQKKVQTMNHADKVKIGVFISSEVKQKLNNLHYIETKTKGKEADYSAIIEKLIVDADKRRFNRG